MGRKNTTSINSRDTRSHRVLSLQEVRARAVFRLGTEGQGQQRSRSDSIVEAIRDKEVRRNCLSGQGQGRHSPIVQGIRDRLRGLLVLIPYYGYRLGLQEGFEAGFTEGTEYAEDFEERLVKEFNFFVTALQREHDWQIYQITSREVVH